MKYILVIFVVLFSASCGPKMFKTPSGRTGYELNCSDPKDCDDKAENICKNLVPNITKINIHSMNDIDIKVICDQPPGDGVW